MEVAPSFGAVGMALGLGLLVGLQRQRAGPVHGGLRTFAVITVLGAVCGVLHFVLGPWIVIVGAVGVLIALVLGNLSAEQRSDPRLLTEFTMLLMYAVGVMTAVGPAQLAVSVGVGVAILLQAKGRLHRLAQRMGDEDMRALLTFAALTFVILPVVPDEGMGPYGVINPHHLWLLVVLVVGIGLTAYVAYKLLGPRHGLWVGGLLGGLISSTATTVSYARRAGGTPAAVPSAAFAVVLAGTVVYGRVLVEVAVAGPALLAHAALPIGLLMGLSTLTALALWSRASRNANSLPEQSNPAALRTAFMFAAAYAVVIVASVWAQRTLGSAGLLAVAALSGLTDMDAITLSSSRLAHSGELAHDAALDSIVVASMSNLVFKTGIAGVLGGWRLLARVGAVAAVLLLASAAVVLFWPG
ncbi:MAG: MgtC/SapB family protein [Phycisphaerae bacterium]|nr:MgtC/SapB family protein [Phycisphaerae bacterium]